MGLPLHGYPAPEGKPVFGSDGRRIIYDENGKPCRTCNTLSNFRMATAKKTAGNEHGSSSNTSKGEKPGLAVAAATGVTVAVKKDLAPDGYPKDCPADVEELGHSTWTFLHTVAAMYPERATEQQQTEMKEFLETFSKIYPCWFCAKGFRKYIKANEPKVMTQDEFGRWLCDAHNAVNKKLGKPHFDCNLWKKRWKDGWEDGKCD